MLDTEAPRAAHWCSLNTSSVPGPAGCAGELVLTVESLKGQASEEEEKAQISIYWVAVKCCTGGTGEMKTGVSSGWPGRCGGDT